MKNHIMVQSNLRGTNLLIVSSFGLHSFRLQCTLPTWTETDCTERGLLLRCALGMIWSCQAVREGFTRNFEHLWSLFWPKGVNTTPLFPLKSDPKLYLTTISWSRRITSNVKIQTTSWQRSWLQSNFEDYLT